MCTANSHTFAVFSPYTVLLNTLRVYSEYAERMKNMQKFSLSTMPGDFKGTVFPIFCSHCIRRIRITAKNKGKLSTSQFIIVHHEKNYKYPAELKSAPARGNPPAELQY
jgi:hypothetical protein